MSMDEAMTEPKDEATKSMDEATTEPRDDATKKKANWYASSSPLWPGEAHSLMPEKYLYMSKDHNEMVFQSASYGRAVLVDGAIEFTEKINSSYYEMLAHLPLCSLQDPKKVLIIGDRHGGIAEEATRHPSVKQIHVSLKDEMRVPASSMYFPNFGDYRVMSMKNCDVSELLKNEGPYDAVILDPRRPISPKSGMFDMPLYELVAKALCPGGIFCSRAESYWNDRNIVKGLVEKFSQIFDGSVKYAWTNIPTYPSGVVGFVLCSTKGPSPIDFENPRPMVTDQKAQSRAPLYCYNREIHVAAFIVPDEFLNPVHPEDEAKSYQKRVHLL